jgi:DNA-binding transcriptional LysR family regulator
MIKRFVAEGLGVSIISSAFAAEDADAGRVKLIELENVHIGRELGVVYRKDRSLPRAATAFIELVKKRRSTSRAEISK